MNTADTTENTEKKTSALPAKKVSDSETHQLHVVIHPDINGFGRLFGGRLLEWIDEVAGATARRHCGRDATTVAIDNLYFKSGAYLNDIIVLIGKVTHVGHTSMEVRVDTYRKEQDGTRHPINRAYFVMVAMGDDGKPTPVPGLILENDGERMEWPNATSSRTVSFIWTLLAWVRMASRLLSSRLFQRVISVPSKSTRPLSRAIRRDSIPITVDFPAPFGPMRERTLPFGTSKLTPSTTAFPS